MFFFVEVLLRGFIWFICFVDSKPTFENQIWRSILVVRKYDIDVKYGLLDANLELRINQDQNNSMDLVKLWRPHTSFHPKWWFSKGNPLISGKSRLVKYYNLDRLNGSITKLSLSHFWAKQNASEKKMFVIGCSLLGGPIFWVSCNCETPILLVSWY